MNKLIIHTMAFYILVLVVSCNSQTKDAYFPYNINHPDATYSLPKALKEISGLAYYSEEKFYCIQDEAGTVFQYNLKTENIDREIDFGKDNDYEDIALVDDDLYVLKSNGNLYRIKNINADKPSKTKEYKTFLSPKCDAEGLCYDKSNNRLLIACKERFQKGGKYKNIKSVYSFDLAEKKLKKKPVYAVNTMQVSKLKRTAETQKFHQEFLDFFGVTKCQFSPSSLAIHPLTNDVFILSSVGNTLLVLSSDNKIKCAVHLKHANFKQPEGISFGEDGTMYISNEGRKGRGTIKTFNYKPLS